MGKPPIAPNPARHRRPAGGASRAPPAAGWPRSSGIALNASVAPDPRLCGAVRFRAQWPTKWIAHCHCTTRRRDHGAPFVTWAGFQTEQFELEPNGSRPTRHESSPGTRRAFRGTCGSPVFLQSTRQPGANYPRNGAAGRTSGGFGRAAAANAQSVRFRSSDCGARAFRRHPGAVSCRLRPIAGVRAKFHNDLSIFPPRFGKVEALPCTPPGLARGANAAGGPGDCPANEAVAAAIVVGARRAHIDP
jgi:hypothetical protein